MTKKSAVKTTDMVIRVVPAGDLPPSFFAPRLIGGVEEAVGAILRDVRDRGDAAVLEAGARFDGVTLPSLRITPEAALEAEARFRAANPAVYEALVYSRDMAFGFAKKQRECFVDFETELAGGLFTGQKNIPVERAGVYIPAGRFPLLSSAIMTLCPAIAAGVGEIVVCTPPKAVAPPAAASDPPAPADQGILAAVSLCMALAERPAQVFAAGGAQAIAAMAYGTESVPPCDVVVGPGNRYVAEAKRQIFGRAGIDILAGPTEVLIIADKDARPDFVAADMAAQAEHDCDAQAVVITDSEALARAVQGELARILETLPTAETARKSLGTHGLIILAEDLREALDIADRKAPEHLELALDAGPLRDFFVRSLRNYGSLFIGHRSAEVLGDYSAGLNHTLPTSASARFTGGLSVRCFIKTVTTLRAEDGPGVTRSLEAAETLGLAEGLAGHAAAAQCRL
jgi:histidinol dehydrogenase